MATWPSASKASTTNLDSGTDSPAAARADIKQNVDNVNSIIDMFNIDSPSNNQILKYNSTNNRFELATDQNTDAVTSVNGATGVVVLDTDDVSEGTTNKYFSNTLARGAFSAGTGITITDGSIATTITQYADSNARASISVTDTGGDGSLSYNNTSGVITYTGPGISDYRAAFSAGTGITITDGVIASTVTSGITDIVQDTTPQLGGNLDVNGQQIVSVSNGNIVIAPNGTGIVRADKSVQIQAEGEIRLADNDSSNYVGFKAPATVSSNRIWTLPAADGSNGQVLSTNGSGALSWATAGGGGNSYAVLGTTDYYITLTASTTLGNSSTQSYVELYDPNNIVTLGKGVSNLYNFQIILGAGHYLMELYSAGALASGSVNSNAKANTGALLFKLVNETTSTTVNQYYQEATQFWTGSATSFEVGMGPVVMSSYVNPTSTTTYSYTYTHSGLNKQFNNFSSPGRAFTIVITKLA